MKKIELTKEEIEFLKEILKDSFENSYFKGDFNEFEEYSDFPEKGFLKKVNILNSLRKKIK